MLNIATPLSVLGLRGLFYLIAVLIVLCGASAVADNEKGLWSDGEFETQLPERPPM